MDPMLHLFFPTFKAKILFTLSAEEQLFILSSLGLQSFVIVILMNQNMDAVNEIRAYTSNKSCTSFVQRPGHSKVQPVSLNLIKF